MNARASTVALVLWAVVGSACQSPPTPTERFERTVVPVLERYCTASDCHGVSPASEARGDQVDWGQLFFHTDDDGRITDLARAYATTKRVINTTEPARHSSLLRKPLAVAAGGVGHLGGAQFNRRDNPAYRAVEAWIESESDGGQNAAPLSDAEQRYVDEVQPLLVDATCTTARCHGPTAGAIPLSFDPGVDGQFSIAASRHNYEQVRKLITLDGYPEQSRLIRKAQALGKGIVHKGLNFDFFADVGRGGIETLKRWICAERTRLTGHACAAEGELPMSGFVYVRGPVAAHHPFELDTFVPGSDLHLATLDATTGAVRSTENLTASLHPGAPADVRDPAVSRDGTQVVFAMRTQQDRGHHLWLLDLSTRATQQLTFDNGALPGGGLATDRDPTFGPDGSIWFASTRAGHVADQGQLLDAELYSLDLATGATRRWTFSPHAERKPVFFDLGEEAGGEVSFSVLRDAIPDQTRAHVFRFPPSKLTEYHQHFGITTTQDFVHDMRELPDGRYVSVVGALPAIWQAGQLAIVDRNLGPEINARSESQAPAMELYSPPMVLLAGDGVYRDPAALPNGQLLVAHQLGDFDASDPNAVMQPRIELLTLTEALDGTGPTLADTRVLMDEPGVALTDPEPVSVRAPVQVSDAPIDPDQPATALLRHQGMAMIDALLSNLPPSGTKEPLAGIAYVRLIEDLPMTPDARAPLSTGDADVDGITATTTALGSHGPARILAELPVQRDASFQTTIPANIAFRLQALDEDRMAIGTMHNRWFYALPGQTLTLGIASTPGQERYGSRCASCHGDAHGSDLPPAQEDPDTITGASLSLARFSQQHPRRPIAPTQVGHGTRVEVDFQRDVQPILDRKCVTCHGNDAPAAQLDLTGTPTDHFSRAYESLLRRAGGSGAGSGNGRQWVDDGDGRARSSHLIERLLGRELDAPQALPTTAQAHPAPGEGEGPLSADELLTLVRWIELGASFVGRPGPERAP